MYTSSPAFSIPSMSRKVFQADQDQSPGPLYNTFGLNKNSKMSSFGNSHSKRTEINHGIQKTPAPTQYQPKVIKDKPMISFPKSKYQQKIDEDMPDPGFYSSSFQEGQIKGKNFSIGSKYSSIMDDINKVPGPGTYEILSSIRNTFSSHQKIKRSKSFSTFNTTAQRFKSLKKQPGPGDYNLSPNNLISKSRNGEFLKSSKEPIITNFNPGPGQYQQSLAQKIFNSKLSVTFKGKNKNELFPDREDFTKNAFLTHNVTQSLQKVKKRILSYKIGSSERKMFTSDNLPGPQDYFKQGSNINPVQMIKFAESKRRDYITNQNPGPGEYNPESAKTLSYSIKRSQSGNLFEKNVNPGVGRYDISGKIFDKGGKGALFLSSSRTNFVSKNMAGVGDYDIRGRVKSAITIPKSARFNEKISNPGPGDYNIPSSIGKYWSSKPKKNLH